MSAGRCVCWWYMLHCETAGGVCLVVGVCVGGTCYTVRLLSVCVLVVHATL